MLPLLPLLAPLPAAEPTPAEAGCPEDAGPTTVRRAVEELLGLLDGADAAAREQAEARLLLLLSCTPEPPQELAARAFLLLAAAELRDGGEPEPFLEAARTLDPELETDQLPEGVGERFTQVPAELGEQKGVILASEQAFGGRVHVVGTRGPGPWVISQGTFTFEAPQGSIPVSVEHGALTTIQPSLFEETALVESSRLPSTEPPVEEGSAPTATADLAPGGTALTAGAPSPSPEDGGEDDEPYSPSEEDTPPFLAPHALLSLSAELAGPGDDGPGGSFHSLGAGASLGLLLRLGDRLWLSPELGARLGSGARPEAVLPGEGAPVEPTRDSARWLQADLLLGLRRGSWSYGLGPAYARGLLRVTGETDCGGTSCTAPSEGRVAALGLLATAGLHPRWFPLYPACRLEVLGDGDRLYLATSLDLAWDGKP